MSVANFHIPIPSWAMLALMTLSLGLITFGDPSAIWPGMLWVTPLFKTVVAIFGLVQAVCVVKGAGAGVPAAPAMPH
jgi:hypothetical protein